MFELELHSLLETQSMGERLGALLEPGMLITLSGDLGAGKTTLTKSIGKALGVTKVINSPTFTILKTYKGNIPLYHIDAYRLEGIHQDLGFEEYMDGDGVCVVEWPQYMEDQLPASRLEISLYATGEQMRVCKLHPIGEVYEKIVRELQ